MIDRTHDWDLSPAEAAALQSEWAGAVVRHDAFGPIAYVAGVDVAYGKESDQAVAAAVVLDAESLEVVEIAVAQATVRFPYLPHLFSFRELPPILDALAKLRTSPNLILCDGHGVAHPRRFGLASHLGLLSDVPTIGCAKTLLVGRHDRPDPPRGSRAPLLDGEEVVGAALRTQTDVRPLYVSIGHRIGLDTACDWVLRLAPRYRLPETTRAADHAVRMALRSWEATAPDARG